MLRYKPCCFKIKVSFDILSIQMVYCKLLTFSQNINKALFLFGLDSLNGAEDYTLVAKNSKTNLMHLKDEYLLQYLEASEEFDLV